MPLTTDLGDGVHAGEPDHREGLPARSPGMNEAGQCGVVGKGGCVDREQTGHAPFGSRSDGHGAVPAVTSASPEAAFAVDGTDDAVITPRVSASAADRAAAAVSTSGATMPI